jgi:hypothetical protein
MRKMDTIIKMKAEAKEIYVPTFVSGVMDGNFASPGALKLVCAIYVGSLRLIIRSRFSKVESSRMLEASDGEMSLVMESAREVKSDVDYGLRR